MLKNYLLKHWYSLAVIVIGLFLIGLSIAATSLMYTLNQQSTVISQNRLPAVKILEQIATGAANLRAAEAGEITQLPEMDRLVIHRLVANIDQKILSYVPLISGEEEQLRYAHFHDQYRAYLRIQKKLLHLTALNQTEKANELFLTESLRIFQRMSNELNKLSNYNEIQALKISENGDDIYETVNNFVLSISLLSVILMLAWVFSLFKKYMIYRNSLESRVNRALDNRTFHCVYQPIVNMNENKIIGVEVLARLKDRYGDVYPDEFIPLIALEHRSWEFTEHIIETALSELTQLGVSLVDFKVSFNIFPSDINDNQIAKITRLNGIQSFQGKIVLEVTESEILEHESAKLNMEKMVAQGFELAIDDFGTGYANFHQLKAMSAKYLKIDRSFVMDMEEDSIKSALIRHILPIARDLNMQVVAEGVENERQHRILRDIGVDYGQGWHYGKPKTIDHLWLHFLNQTDTSVVKKSCGQSIEGTGLISQVRA
ncbi:EAL domain-containing protein [Vibrio cyclitrophicus]